MKKITSRSKLALRIAGFNLLHIVVMLLVTFIYAIINTFITKEVGQESANKDLAYRLIEIAVLTPITTFTLGLFPVIATVVLVQVISVPAILTNSNLLSGLRFSMFLTIGIALPYYILMCYSLFSIPMLFWIGYPMFLLLEIIKWRKYSKQI